MSSLATFANRSELAAAIRGKSDRDILAEAKKAGVETILQKVFMGMMMSFDAEKATQRKAVVEYDIAGPEGTRYRYQVNVSGGTCTIDPEAKGTADLKLTASVPTFLKVSANTANPLFLVVLRKLKIKGDMKLAGELPRWFSKRI
jgi:putative sterol carrier protein